MSSPFAGNSDGNASDYFLENIEETFLFTILCTFVNVKGSNLESHNNVLSVSWNMIDEADIAILLYHIYNIAI